MWDLSPMLEYLQVASHFKFQIVPLRFFFYKTQSNHVITVSPNWQTVSNKACDVAL